MTLQPSFPVGEKPKTFGTLFYDQRLRSILYQGFTFGLVAWVLWYLFSTSAANLEARGMSTGFGFFNHTAGFDTDFKLVDHSPGDTYGRIFLIGILNTLFVSWGAIIGATLLGTVVGIARLSSNWIVAKLASGHVELLRNTPLLLQIVTWYLFLLPFLPRPKQSIDVFGLGSVFLNNRGLYLPTPEYGDGFWLTPVAIGLSLLGALAFRRAARRHRERTGRRSGIPAALIILMILTLPPTLVFLISGSPLEWQIPALGTFNFEGGTRLPPSFVALLIALTVYHSAGCAESVRAGLQSVDKGQREAAYAAGLSSGQTLRLVVLPQAMRATVPPMISLWLSLVKNSSLGVAIGYPEIVSLFMQTSLNQSGYAIEIVALTMLFYMAVSLIISACLNIYNRAVQFEAR